MVPAPGGFAALSMEVMIVSDRPLFGRRRQANVTHGRAIRHVVKVTPEEEAQLLGRAHEQQVSVPRLMVDAALAPEGGISMNERRQAAVEITEVRRLLASIANNANQVAKYANTEGAIPDWIDAVMEDYRALRPRLNAAVDDLAG